MSAIDDLVSIICKNELFFNEKIKKTITEKDIPRILDDYLFEFLKGFYDKAQLLHDQGKTDEAKIYFNLGNDYLRRITNIRKY